MESPAVFPPRGFMVEVEQSPKDIGLRLQRAGVADAALETAAGLYVEPTSSLDAVLRALLEAGAHVRTLRPAGSFQSRERVRPAQRPVSRLRNPRCAEWFPLVTPTAA